MDNVTKTRSLLNLYGLRIICALRGGPLRFNQIDRAVDIPHAPLLASILKKLARDGLVVRHVHKLGPPAVVSYELTSLGRDLSQHAAPVLNWIADHVEEIETSRERHRMAATPKGNDPVLIADRVNTGRSEPSFD
jgi:DNA-binding HxlR family transcriptional regulator